MAELVDALVSKTSEFTLLPVRLRLRVQKYILAAVYILYSIRIDRYYVGYTKDIAVRVHQHQNKFYKGSYTVQADDWEVKLLIEALSISEAIKMERYIKRMKSRKYIQQLIEDKETLKKLKAAIQSD